MLTLYRFITIIASPVIYLYLLNRRRKGKEDVLRFSERFGRTNLSRPNGKLIWIHAASVGESLSVIPLITKLSEAHQNINILVTTGTTSSAKLMETRLPKKAFHQYIPIDKICAVKQFLKHWQPNVALWVESELWPNLITETSKTCPVILINGRMSDSSYKIWSKYTSLSSAILSSFSLVLPQSKQDEERFRKLGAKNVKLYGNLKYDSAPLPADVEKLSELVKAISGHKIWLASSTHSNEEQIVAGIHKQLKKDIPNLITIIAPRHPKRANDILADIADLDLNISLRSANQPISEKTDIYLADTMGELGIFYRLAPVVFIGGSLVAHGGQNPLEAARLDCSIIYGPHMENFREIEAEFKDSRASISIKDPEELHKILTELFQNSEKQKELARNALELVKGKSGILDAYLKDLSSYI